MHRVRRKRRSKDDRRAARMSRKSGVLTVRVEEAPGSFDNLLTNDPFRTDAVVAVGVALSKTARHESDGGNAERDGRTQSGQVDARLSAGAHAA